MTTATETRHVIIGTAGHIDHGKTRLVGRLTGIMTDRLPEEKARGISIDLGFAHWESAGFQFGVVDVPGHERFVKNMVAGATGVNLALLVVAADDSVMPQTREHLEIMDLLGVRTGAVVITKIDLVDPDFVDLVMADVEDVVAGTFLEGCPIIPVSSETGAGIEELRETITRIANEIEWPESHEVFRMPIDRVFSITGHGSVVTGSALTGEVHAGDILELLPEGRDVRVRSVQSHGSGVEEGGARQRTAVNLAGLKTDELARGMEIATPGFLKPTQRMIVELRHLTSSPIVLKDRIDVNLHLGTAEVPARVILKGNTLKPGESGFAELRTKVPAVAAHGQRFILRRVSPAVTIAGGTVLDPFVPPLKRIKDLAAYAEAAKNPNDVERISFLLSQRDSADVSAAEALWRAGVGRERYAAIRQEMQAAGELIALGKGDRQRTIHRKRLKALSGSVLRTIKEELERHQPRRALPRTMLLSACREITRADLLELVFEHLMQTQQLVTVGKNIGPADAQVQLTKKQRQARETILAETANAGLMPPTVKDLATAVGQPLAEIGPVLNVCVEDGLLIRIGDSLYFTPENLEQARSVCENTLKETPEATMAQLRDAWGVSRKYSVPLCEYFDSLGVTIRKDDLRIAGPKISDAII